MNVRAGAITTVGNYFRCAGNHRNFHSHTVGDQMVLQEPREIELGVDLCPGELQLIYCLSKEGLDWK
jgi:hypothetical protein